MLKLQDLGWQRSTPFDSKFFIYNRFVISQAECRGFDPRLPLHKLNNLGRLYGVESVSDCAGMRLETVVGEA